MKEVFKRELAEIFKKLKQGTKTMFKEFTKKETNKKQRANMWTFSRLVSAGIIPILTIIGVITNSFPFIIAAIMIATYGASTDLIDGMSARKHKSYSEFGAILDAITDKIFSSLLGLSLSLINPLFLLNIFGEALITLTNVIYKTRHEEIEVRSTKMGKIKQWPLSATFILGIISILVPSLSIVTNTSIIITLLTQMMAALSYVDDNNKQIKEFKEKKITKENNETKEPDNKKTNNLTLKKQELINLRNVLKEILNNETEKEKEKIRIKQKK